MLMPATDNPTDATVVTIPAIKRRKRRRGGRRRKAGRREPEPTLTMVGAIRAVIPAEVTEITRALRGAISAYESNQGS